jgi:aldehyde dehydrogenase (NAD+)
MASLDFDEVTEFQQFVDGDYRPSTGEARIEVDFPYDGSVWATVPDGTPADVSAAVGAARDAFETEYSQWRPSERRELLYQIGDVIEAHADELAELETRQNGKLLREMRPQMGFLAEYYRYFGRQAEEVGTGRVNPMDNKDGGMFNYTRREPYGVVGAITPWNSPLLLATSKIAPALAAGNTFVHKPSEHTPVSALRFAELLDAETDMPSGVYNVVTGASATGAALVDHEAVDKLSFTGSTAVGREIAKTAGEHLTAVTLELGGKSPNVIFPSADLENAVNGVMKGIFAATGQTCMAGSRVLVHEDIRDEFVDRLTDRAADIQLGDPLDPDTQLAPVAFREQWEKVKHYVDVGVDEGATLAFGGERPADAPGDLFIQPTILVDVDNGMQVAQEEIFGPVASVISFATETEALEIANDVDFGLAGAVWTADMNQANRMVEGIRAGNVWVNDYRVVNFRSPFGGYKDSGLGVEGGPEGLSEYYQSKSVYYNYSGEVGDPFSLDT